jgi:hypothetical protein
LEVSEAVFSEKQGGNKWLLLSFIFDHLFQGDVNHFVPGDVKGLEL